MLRPLLLIFWWLSTLWAWPGMVLGQPELPTHLSGSLPINSHIEAQRSGDTLWIRHRTLSRVYMGLLLSKPPQATQKGKAQAISATFLELAFNQPKVKDRMGTFHFESKYSERLRQPTVDSVVMGLGGQHPYLDVRGHFADNPNFAFTIRLMAKNETLWWYVFVENQKGDSIKHNTLFFRTLNIDNEQVYGLGEQFVSGPLNGGSFQIWVEEQGIGRGLKPITGWVNMAVKGAAGDYQTTYTPMARWMTTAHRGFQVEHDGYLRVDISQATQTSLEAWRTAEQTDGPELMGVIEVADSFPQLMTRQAHHTGLMPPLPEWAYGTWMGLQGGWDAVLPRIAEAQTAGNPITALWIQDWCGRRVTRFGSQLWWRWLPDTTLYPNFPGVVDSLRQAGVKTLGYVNAFLATEGPMYDTAVARGYLVRNPKGEVYPIETPGFPAVLVDLINPEAFFWLRNIIQMHVAGNGLAGWMADYAEWLPWDAVVQTPSGPASGADWHNRYAVLWAQLNRQVADSIRAQTGDTVLFFTRSGHTHTPRHTTLHWMGDQLVTWDGFDGLASTIPAMIHGGLSGLTLNHSDIGGYTTLSFPTLRYQRSRELLLRWAELNTLGPVFRTHEGLRPDDNHQVYSDSATVAAFAKLSKLHWTLKPYLKFVVQQASERGWPLWRPLWFHYPDDSLAHRQPNVFLVGSDLLFAPVLAPNDSTVIVYLPQGRWWNPQTQTLLEGGRTYTLPSPLGKPCLLVRQDAPWRKFLGDVLRDFTSN